MLRLSLRYPEPNVLVSKGIGRPIVPRVVASIVPMSCHRGVGDCAWIASRKMPL